MSNDFAQEIVGSLTDEQRRFVNSTHKLPEEPVSNAFSGLSVCGMVADWSACGYYRVVLPLHMLKLHGAHVQYKSVMSITDISQYDYIVAPRQTSEPVYDILRYASWMGKTVIGENDDDLHHVVPSNPAYAHYRNGSPQLRTLTRIFSREHGLTTTTYESAKWHSRFNVNVGILDNYIDFGLRQWCADVSWGTDPEGFLAPQIDLKPVPRRPEWDGKFVVGYCGGSSHRDDLPMIGAEILSILALDPSVHLALCMPADMTTEFVHQFKVPESRLTRIPTRHFLDYPTALYGIDVQLAPIQCHQFNLAKSSLKAKESLAAGSAFIGSCVAPYARFAEQHPESILLVGNNKHSAPTWRAAVSYLLRNPDVLERMQREGRQLVADHHSLERHFQLWPSVWQQIRDQVHAGRVGAPVNPGSPEKYVSYGTIGPNDPCPISESACCQIKAVVERNALKPAKGQAWPTQPGLEVVEVSINGTPVKKESFKLVQDTVRPAKTKGKSKKQKRELVSYRLILDFEPAEPAEAIVTVRSRPSYKDGYFGAYG